MKRKLLLISATIALLALGVPAIVLAQSKEASTTVTPPLKGSVDIVAPHAAPVNQQVQMTVFYSVNQTTVDGAGVWAVSADKVDTVKKDIEKAKKQAAPEMAAAAEEALDMHATLLGRTGPDGKIQYTFTNEGRYLLVAFKPGCWPDLRPIAIGVKVVRPALVLAAPKRAAPGEKFDVAVTEKGSGDAVKGAKVWALSREKAEAVKAQMGTLKQDTDAGSLEARIENALDVSGVLLGTTNGDGKLEPQPSLDAAGAYVLVTFKPGYWPTWKPILVGSAPQALAIDAPDRAKANENVSITVTEKGTGDAAKDVGVWALTREQAASLKVQVESLKQNAADQSTLQAGIESLLKSNGVFLGVTNGAGKVEPQPSFQNAGGYLLVAYKPGYWPAMKPIVIVDPQTVKPSIARIPKASGNTAIAK